MEAYHVKSNLGRQEGGKCDKHVSEAVADSNLFLLMTSDLALSLAVVWNRFRVVVFIISVALTVLAAYSFYQAFSIWNLQGKYFKLESCAGYAYVQTLVSFNYGDQICGWPQSFYNTTITDTHLTFEYADNIKITGWTHWTANTVELKDEMKKSDQSRRAIQQQPVAKDSEISDCFRLYRSVDGKQWEAVIPPWQDSNLIEPMSSSDLRPPLWWILHHVVSPAVLAISFGSGCISGARGAGCEGARRLALGWLLSSCFTLFALLLNAPHSLAISCFARASIALLCYADVYLLEGCLAVGSLQLCCMLLSASRSAAVRRRSARSLGRRPIQVEDDAVYFKT